MSARLNGNVDDPGPGDAYIHDWIEAITGGVDFVSLEASRVATTCAAAVDPLEIAAALEVAGISHTVATDRYGRADVFSLANTLWNTIPMRAVRVSPPAIQRPGNWRDIARGMLYAAPAVMLLAVSRMLDLDTGGWTLPLAITWSWGVGQMATYSLHRMNSSGDERAVDEVAGLVLSGACAIAMLLALGAVVAVGGGMTAIVMTISLALFTAASAIMLFHDEERWSALVLAPGWVVSIVVLGTPDGTVQGTFVAAAIGGSCVAIVASSLRHVAFRRRSDVLLGRHGWMIAGKHLLHGLICGVAVSIVVTQGQHDTSGAGEFAQTSLSVPLLATLGIAEWQLRTFRSRTAHLARTLESFQDFPKRAWAECRRSLLIYATSITVATVFVAAFVQHHQLLPISLAAVQIVLGCAFFLDLLVVALGRLDLVLGSWAGGVCAGVAWLVGSGGVGSAVSDGRLWPSACIGLVATFIALLGSARVVASTAMNH